MSKSEIENSMSNLVNYQTYYFRGDETNIYIIDAKEYIKERHAKFICYELLMIIKNIQKIKICLNNINIFQLLIK